MRFVKQTFAITAVRFERQRIFQRVANAELMVELLFRQREQGRYLLHGFVVMPDHLHVLVTPAESVEKSAQMIKGGFSFAVRGQYKGEVWPKSFHEHRVRDGEDFRSQLGYIAMNPVRKGYEGYPYVHTMFSDRMDGIPEHLLDGARQIGDAE